MDDPQLRINHVGYYQSRVGGDYDHRFDAASEYYFWGQRIADDPDGFGTIRLVGLGYPAAHRRVVAGS